MGVEVVLAEIYVMEMLSYKISFQAFIGYLFRRRRYSNNFRGTQGEETLWNLRFRRDFQDGEGSEFKNLLALHHQHCEPLKDTIQ